jgi:DNA-binding NarL/FixJ family response regulator
VELEVRLGAVADPGMGLTGGIVDLFARRSDGVEAVRRLAAAGVPVIAVAEHDDMALRKRAIAAGAQRVWSYNKLFTDGPAVLAAWTAAQGGIG